MLQSWVICILAVGGLFHESPQDDFKIRFTVDKETYLLGEPIIVAAELTNTSGGRKTIIFNEINYSTTIRLVIKNAKGEIAKNEYGVVDFKGGYEAFKKTLEDKEILPVIIDATREYPIQDPGEYTIQATYRFAFGNDKIADVWEGSVISDLQKIRIILPEKEDDKKILRAIQYGPAYRYSPEICEAILKISKTSEYSKYARCFLADSSLRWMKRSGYVKSAFDECLKLYTEAVSDKFTLSDEAQLGIAKCWVIKGDLDMAAKEAQKVSDNFPNSNSVDEAKELLKQLGEKQEKKNIDTLRKK